MKRGASDHSWFKRYLLPGLGVKAVVIGGGYATGRELAEFFLSRGPWGGLLAILFATLLFSIFCPLTFVVARRFGTYDYRSFFKRLLGPAWPLFELSYLLFAVLILAVYGAAAGAIARAIFDAPEWVGTIVLMAGIAGGVAFGNKAVERLFRDVSYLLYGVYALFIILALVNFGDRVPAGFAAHAQTSGWALSGLTYFGYNIIGAVVLLVGCLGLGGRFGLVALIANGYRAIAYILLATYILPLVTIGVWKLWRMRRAPFEPELPLPSPVQAQE